MIALAAQPMIRASRRRTLALTISLLLALVIAASFGVSASHAEAFADNSGLTQVETTNPVGAGDSSAPDNCTGACSCTAQATGLPSSIFDEPTPSTHVVNWPAARPNFRPGGEVPLQERPPRV